MRVTACIVTRGDVDLKPILDNLVFDDVIVWDNSKEEDFGTYGRYMAAKRSKTKAVYFQDDDMIVPKETQRALVEGHSEGTFISNMPKVYREHTFFGMRWLGWGAVIDKDLPPVAFKRWEDAGYVGMEEPGFKLVGCDIVFSVLSPGKQIEHEVEVLPYAFDTYRVFKQERFSEWRESFWRRASEIEPRTRLNLGCGEHAIKGFVNLDATNGWRFEDGLYEYAAGSVEAITVSHALLYVEEKDWPFVMSEFARVLKPGGVIRITEDSTDDPASPRFGGYPGYATLTSVKHTIKHLRKAGLEPKQVKPHETLFGDHTLIQNLHDGEPKAFFVEAVKP